jgi:hypothetical protein
VTSGPALPRRLQHHYRYSFQDPRRERLFLSSIGFDLGAISARVITHMIRRGRGPFRNLSADGRHIHHLVFGIAGLLCTGYAWLVVSADRDAALRVLALAYGVSSALTLDEFALWLNLQDVYWTEQGKVSVEAVMIFGGLLSIGVWGGRFIGSAAREVVPGVPSPPLRPLPG